MIPTRYRLRAAFVKSEESAEDLLAIAGLVLGLAIDGLMPEPPREQRKLIRSEPIEYGERCADRIMQDGATAYEVIEAGTEHLLASLREMPSNEELEEARDFIEATKEPSIASSSDAA